MAERSHKKDEAMTLRGQDGRRQSIKYPVLENTRRWFRFHYPDLVLVVVLLLLASYSCWPDATLAGNQWNDPHEYTYPTLHLLQGQGLVDIFNGIKYPPTHSFGIYPFLAVSYLLTGNRPGNAVYTVFVMSLACIPLLYYIGVKLLSRTAACCACVFLIASDEFRWLSVQIMSDTTTVCITLAVIALLLSVTSSEHSPAWRWQALGHAIGFSLCVHPANVVFGLPVGGLVLASRRTQYRWGRKVFLLCLGVSFWVVAYLCVNYAYTGDPLRCERMVRQSWQYDRPDHAQSFRNFFRDSGHRFGPQSLASGGGNLDKLMTRSLVQWSLMEVGDAKKRAFYYGLDLLAVLGLVAAGYHGASSKGHRTFLWLLLLILPQILFFARLSIVDDRYLQRIVPYVCLLDGTGAAFLLASKWRWIFAVAVVPVLMAGFCYMLSHPFDDAFRYYPTVVICKDAGNVIAEDDAVILGNLQAPPVEEYVIRGTHRMYVPFTHDNISSHSAAQWKKPPHPEWLPEWAENGMYPRMFENGALLIYPYTVQDNPEQVDRWLHEGKAVYLIWLSVGTDQDLVIGKYLVDRYRAVFLKDGFPLSKTPPAALTNRFSHSGPFIARITLKPSNPRSEVEEAIGHYEQALRLKPDDAEPHNNLGVALLQLGRSQEAIGHFEQAVRIKPDYAEAHYNLGQALGQTGKIKEAIAQFEQALRIKPDFTPAQNALARLQARQ